MRSNDSTRDPFPNEPGDPERNLEDYFFLDQATECDPAVIQLQERIRRIVPVIRDHLRGAFGDDSRWPDYVDRLYQRARYALLTTPDLNDQAIWGRFVSLVHEDRRVERKRFGGLAALKLVRTADPASTDFVSDLARRDQIRAFRECLDEWTKQAFDFRYASIEPRSSKQMAKAFGMKVNTFDQRWNRGIAAAREEYRRRHGDWMP